jgi:hypothetical protein
MSVRVALGSPLPDRRFACFHKILENGSGAVFMLLAAGLPRLAGFGLRPWGTPRCRDRSRGNLGKLPVVGC